MSSNPYLSYMTTCFHNCDSCEPHLSRAPLIHKGLLKAFIQQLGNTSQNSQHVSWKQQADKYSYHLYLKVCCTYSSSCSVYYISVWGKQNGETMYRLGAFITRFYWEAVSEKYIKDSFLDRSIMCQASEFFLYLFVLFCEKLRLQFI